MTDDRSATDRLVSLSLAVPGWQGRLIPEAVQKVAQGVALEQERLRGSRFLVVLRRYELEYDGIREWIEIVSGHDSPESASATAQNVGTRRLAEMRGRLDPDYRWKQAASSATRWPKTPPVWHGARLPIFSDHVWDGVGWNAAEVIVAIVPTDPDNPINLSVIETIDMMWETVHWFQSAAGGKRS